MTLGPASTNRRSSETEFRELVEPHVRALQVHCYRMLGSLHEAEDAVQETLLRAWRRHDTFGHRSTYRAWLYGIATNECLDALRRRRARVLPSQVAPPDDPSAVPAAPRTDIPWLEPYPDHLLETDPAEQLELRETVRLAFVAAVQQLPPRQRAVLLLRDVLGWSAAEVAELLDTSVASVTSALQRARAGVESVPPLERVSPDGERETVSRYIDAWDAADVAGLAALLKEDVEMTMPPTPSWYRGRRSVTDFFTAHFGRFPAGRLRLVPTRANTVPALAVYDGGAPFALKVLELHPGGIRSINGFTDPAIFRFVESRRAREPALTLGR
jgi:RNA polymerase sigma-70 factor (ECF subfamily)